MLSNGWHDNCLPTHSGNYHVIAVMHVKNPNQNPELLVKDGDTIVDIDYFDIDKQDWEKNPIMYSDDGWEIVGWKELVTPMLPTEYNTAILFNNLISQKTA